MSATRPQRTALRRAGTINQMLQLRSETSQAQSLRDSCTRPERARLSASSSSYTAAGVHPAESVRSLGVKSLMPCSLTKLRRLLLLLSGVSLNFLQVCSSCSKGKKKKKKGGRGSTFYFHQLNPRLPVRADLPHWSSSLLKLKRESGEGGVHRGVNSINHKVCASDAISL